MFLLSLFLSAILLQAEDFTYKMTVNTSTPFLKEPVLLNVDINQTNPDVVLFFHFKVLKDPNFLLEQTSAKADNTLHKTTLHLQYRVYPLKTGKVDIAFKLIKRLTNDYKVAYSFSGDRDDFKKLETTDTQIPVPSLHLNVKPLPPETQLVGDFSLIHHIPKKEAESFEPIPFEVTIKGHGYPPVIDHLIPQNNNFTLFADTPKMHKKVTPDGITYTVTYPMALSAQKSFMLPAIRLKAFNPEHEKVYTLEIPQTPIHIKRSDVNTLVDSVDTPPPLHTDWGWLSTLFGYLMAFGAGFAAAWLVKWKEKHPKAVVHPLTDKIDACQEKKALLQLLMAQGDPRFLALIDKLESDLYGKKSHTLTSLKKEAKEILQ